MAISIIVVFAIMLLLAACSRIYQPKQPENGSTIWLVKPTPPPMPGTPPPDKVVFFNAATDNSGNAIDTTKIYEGRNGGKYIWKKNRKTGKLYKKYLKN